MSEDFKNPQKLKDKNPFGKKEFDTPVTKVNPVQKKIEVKAKLPDRLTSKPLLDKSAGSGVASQRGPMGAAGPKGDTGPKGEKGDRGLQGERGPQGLSGPRGITGDKGERGDEGPQGPPGKSADNPVLGFGGQRFRIFTQGIGTSLLTSENRHAAGLKSLAAGLNITLTDSGSGTLTIASTASGGITWNTVAGTSQTLVTNNGYIPLNSSLTTFTLPATAAVGDNYQVGGFGSGGWTLAQNASQLIHFGNATTTTGIGGSIASNNAFDCITVVCVVANTTFIVTGGIGNLTVT